jgi:hypothetical protein
MKRDVLFRTIAILLFLVSAQLVARAQGCSTSPDLTSCVNARVVELVKAKTDQNSNTKQAETPSSSSNSSSLVDQSSASDLFGVGLNLAGLSGNSNSTDNQPNSVSVTTSAYALYAAFKGVDPLNPDFYNTHRDWRRFSVTLGYDEEKLSSGDTQKAKLFGIKYLVINHRDPNRKEFQEAIRSELLTALGNSTISFADVINKVKTFIFTNDAVVSTHMKGAFAEFLNQKETDVKLATFTAAKIALNARQTAVTSPNDRQAVKNTATQTSIAELNSHRTVDGNAAASEVIDAVEKAAADRSKTAQDVADAAQAAADKYAITADAKKIHIAELKSQDIRTLFTFENGFTASNSDQVLLEFRENFINTYMTGPGFEKIKAVLGDSLTEEIDKELQDAKNFVELRKVSLEIIDKIRTAPQLSIAYFTKQRKEGIDEHKAEVIFEWGIAPKWNLTANAAFQYNDSRVIGGDTRSGTFAAQFRYRVNHNDRDLASLLQNHSPIFFDLSAEGSRANGKPTILKAQAKLTIPLWDTGIQFPISVTLANRTELVKEKEVRGNFGFTFDFSKLLSVVQPK